jgi:hypothetical protein
MSMSANVCRKSSSWSGRSKTASPKTDMAANAVWASLISDWPADARGPRNDRDPIVDGPGATDQACALRAQCEDRSARVLAGAGHAKLFGEAVDRPIGRTVGLRLPHRRAGKAATGSLAHPYTVRVA